ncbi:MAG: penicillin-binding protein 1A [Thermodesulfobacteriota bacterium]
MEPDRLEKWVKISISAVMILITVIFIFGILSYFYFTYGLPSIETLRNYKPSTISRFFADDGELIGEFFQEKREVVSLDRMPNHLIQAFVASEDARFFQHKGLDYLAILRALSRNIFSGEILQGGSTITQQVVKSLLLSPEKSFARKIREAILAFKIEKYLTKEEILFLYLNQIYLGHGAYGVAAAAENYFGKSIEELNIAESALLAGLPQAPSKYSPLTYPDQAKKRQQYVLHRMVEVGFISNGQLGRALQTPLTFKQKQNSFMDKAPYFVEVVRKYVEDKYGKDALYRKGFRVYTTIDLNFQRMAQESLESGLKEIEKRQKYEPTDAPEGSLLCFDLASGYVKAMVGGRDFRKSQFNRAIQARRQTGSAFKPIVYASALDKGYTPASLVVDAPIIYEWGEKRWKPKNYGGRFSGPITVRNALTHSVNVATVKIAEDIGLNTITDYAKKLGISSPLQNDLSMALGSSSLSLYELTNAYAVFANQGKIFKPIFIKKILDGDGNLIEENLPLFYPKETPEPEGEQVLTPQTAYLMTYLLEGVVQDGTGWKAKALKRPVAGKTGTTDRYVDAWFIGYTPEFITGVWVGFDDEKSLGENETGSRAASPIWVTFMSKILKDKPAQDFPIPEGVEFAKVDPQTGQLGTGRETLLECFKEGTTPTQELKPPLRTTADFFKYDFNLSQKAQ